MAWRKRPAEPAAVPAKKAEAGQAAGERLDRLEVALGKLERALQVKDAELETLRSVVATCPRCAGITAKESTSPQETKA